MEETLKLGTDVKVGYIQPASNSNFSFLDKIVFHFTDTTLKSGLMTNKYNQIGFYKEKISSTKTIFTLNGTQKDKPRGSNVDILGNKGLSFTLTIILAGKFFTLRNKIFQLLESGEPLWLYLPFYQKNNSAKEISSINKDQLTRDRFYVKVSEPAEIKDNDRKFTTCDINVTFQEISYTQISKEDTFLNNVLSLLDDVGQFMDNVDTSIAEATLAIGSVSSVLYDTANKISSFGNASEVFRNIENLKKNAQFLASSPNKLIDNFTNTAKSFSNLFLSASENVGSKSYMIFGLKSLSDFKIIIKPKGSIYNSAFYVDYNTIKSTIVAGQFVFTLRMLGLICFISIVENLDVKNKDDAISLISILDDMYKNFMLDNSYDGLEQGESKVEFYTRKPRNEHLASKIIPFYIQAKNYLKSLENSLNYDKVLPVKTASNIFDIIYQYYTTDITNENYDEIFQNFVIANKITNLTKIFQKNETAVYPIYFNNL